MLSKVVLVANCIDVVPKYEGYAYIGVDGGAIKCMNQNIPLECAIGDFDSITSEQLEELVKYTEVIKLPTKKDDVDTERALRYAHDKGYEEIILVGVTGKRIDHFMIIYNLLKYLDFNFKVIDDYNTIYRIEPGIHKIKKRTKYISFFPCDKQCISLRGMLYPLDHREILESDFYLSSNEIIGEYGEVETTGTLICFESDDKRDA